VNDTLKIWWRGRTLREQRLLLAMAGLLALVLAWLLVIRPIDDSLSAARERHAAVVLRLAEARGQVAALRKLQAAPAVALPGPLVTTLSNAATEAGFSAARVEPQGAGAALVIIDAARPQAVFGWVRQMEQRHGLVVVRLSANANSDQTLAVQVAFRSRSGG
jgi:general secretion pathway protein M